jgi:hypothetical protein
MHSHSQRQLYPPVLRMKRYYVVPQSVWTDHVHLFHGSSFVQLDETHVLLSTDFNSHIAEEMWHAHPEVSRLGHPQFEQQVQMQDLCSNPQYSHKQFPHEHCARLEAAFGTQHTDTVLDLHAAIRDTYPGMKLNIY